MTRTAYGQPAKDLAIVLRGEQEELTEAIAKLAAMLGRVPRRAVGKALR